MTATSGSVRSHRVAVERFTTSSPTEASAQVAAFEEGTVRSRQLPSTSPSPLSSPRPARHRSHHLSQFENIPLPHTAIPSPTASLRAGHGRQAKQSNVQQLEKEVQVEEPVFEVVKYENVVEVPQKVVKREYKYVEVPQVIELKTPVFENSYEEEDTELYLPVPQVCQRHQELVYPQIQEKYRQVPIEIVIPKFVEAPIPIDLLDDSLLLRVQEVRRELSDLTKNGQRVQIGKMTRLAKKCLEVTSAIEQSPARVWSEQRKGLRPIWQVLWDEGITAEQSIHESVTVESKPQKEMLQSTELSTVSSFTESDT